MKSTAALAAKKVALIHYWLVGMRGGEKVLESLCELFPNADIFTHVVDPTAISPQLRRHRIIETRIGRLPFARRHYQKYLPLMPRALEQLDLSGYDLILSSEAGPAKGVIAPPDVPHLCYCHSPMRYIWDQYHVYYKNSGAVTRAFMPGIAHKMRLWDVSSAARVDKFIANSNLVSARVRKYWRRNSEVVPPPVAIEKFDPVKSHEIEDYYLWVGNLTAYKRPDLAIEAFKRLDRPLVVIGGPERDAKKLARHSGPNTQFLGQVPFHKVKYYLERCRALIFPGEEDFGIVPVEAMAAGRPVIAYGRGGVTDSVVHGQTGWFFDHQSVEGLVDAVMQFEKSDLCFSAKQDCLTRAQRFSGEAFQTKILQSIQPLMRG
ncbi:MAG: glycosyltransferase [Cognatishimia sp.]|uniref:glycosyltransferase n=1 Tax=Cognatishimia sp. TaxID=2211648 RepID=UPI003B8B33D9